MTLPHAAGTVGGQAWELWLSPEQQRNPDWRIATSERDARGLHLRIVGPQLSMDAIPTAPTPEEAYLVLMTDEQPAAQVQLLAA